MSFIGMFLKAGMLPGAGFMKSIAFGGALPASGNAISIVSTGSNATDGTCLKIGTSGTPITSGTTNAGAVKVYSDTSGTVGWFVGAWFQSQLTEDGYNSVYTIRGHVDVKAGVSAEGDEDQFLVGVHGRARISGTIDNDSVVVAGVLAQMLHGGTLTKVENMAALWVNNQLRTNPTTGDLSMILIEQSNSSGAGIVDQVFKITGGGNTQTYFEYLFNFERCTTDAFVSASLQSAKVVVDASDRYIVLSQAEDALSLSGVAAPIVLASGGAMTVGIGISGTLAAATSRAIKSAVTIADGALTDGYGANEFDLTLTGTTVDHCAALSSWITIPTGVTLANGGQNITPLTVGIWTHAGATITGASIIFGMKMQAIMGTSDPTRLCCFDLNVSGDILHAIFALSGGKEASIGFTADDSASASMLGQVPLFVDSNQVVYYVRVYQTE